VATLLLNVEPIISILTRPGVDLSRYTAPPLSALLLLKFEASKVNSRPGELGA